MSYYKSYTKWNVQFKIMLGFIDVLESVKKPIIPNV